MKVYILINSIILVALAAFCAYLFYKMKSWDTKHYVADSNEVDGQEFDWKIRWLLVLAVLLVLLSGVSPLLFTSKAYRPRF